MGNTSEDWVEVAKMEIDKRIKNYAENEIRFNLLAIIKNKKSVVKIIIYDSFLSMKMKLLN